MEVMIRNGLSNGMVILYKYIFYNAYYFCINVFKEKEFPWAWAGMTSSMVFVATLVAMLELIEFLMLPSRINTYGEYHGYFSLGMAMLSVFFVRYNNNYQKILKDVETLPLDVRKRVKYLSVFYVLVVVISFFYLGYLIRENT